eukprot:CAMPEP_0173375092 /NCGR_PEP_ID=MMETSP1144-20121109/29445_1 /TAXON_ID=483371 /ORGANISM="non described non described, Strain CCMP2298" /LENGTH=125 /DNA_ID=CAMNT_0014327507 /DNA_START=388 /DNA_END=765 /DNA_ORIENTATION=+
MGIALYHGVVGLVHQSVHAAGLDYTEAHCALDLHPRPVRHHRVDLEHLAAARVAVSAGGGGEGGGEGGRDGGGYDSHHVGCCERSLIHELRLHELIEASDHFVGAAGNLAEEVQHVLPAKSLELC